MDRNATEDFIAELGKQSNAPIFLIDFVLDVPLYVTSALMNISYNSKLYVAAGNFLGLSAIEEQSKLIVSNVTITLSGVNQGWIAVVLSSNTFNKQVIIRKAFLTSSYQLIANPLMVFTGNIDTVKIQETPGEECLIDIECSGYFGDYYRKKGRLTNDNSQKFFYSGDKGFELMSQQGRNIIWGRAE